MLPFTTSPPPCLVPHCGDPAATNLLSVTIILLLQKCYIIESYNVSFQNWLPSPPSAIPWSFGQLAVF